MDQQPCLVVIDLLADLIGQPAATVAAALNVDLTTNAAITIKSATGTYSVHLSIEDGSYATNLGQQPVAVLPACKQAASYLIYTARTFYNQLRDGHPSLFAAWATALPDNNDNNDNNHHALDSLKINMDTSNLYLAANRAHIGIIVLYHDDTATAIATQ